MTSLQQRIILQIIWVVFEWFYIYNNLNPKHLNRFIHQLNYQRAISLHKLVSILVGHDLLLAKLQTQPSHGASHPAVLPSPLPLNLLSSSSLPVCSAPSLFLKGKTTHPSPPSSPFSRSLFLAFFSSQGKTLNHPPPPAHTPFQWMHNLPLQLFWVRGTAPGLSRGREECSTHAQTISITKTTLPC